MLQRFFTDCQSAARALGRRRGTVAVAVLTLAVAVGLNLAMFGLVDRALLSPPAHVADPDRVFTVGFERQTEDGRRARMTTTSYVVFETLRSGLAAGGRAAAWQRTTTGVLVDGAQVSAATTLVSADYFALVGATPLLGRAIQPADSAAASPVAVISYGFWSRMFGAERTVLGRRIRVRGLDYEVIGVMPGGFSGHSALAVDVWVPFEAAMQATPGWDRDEFRNFLSIVIRLPKAQSVDAATAGLRAAFDAPDRRVTLAAIAGGDVSAAEQRIAYWLTGVSVLVLIVGLANAATLLLVRGAERRRDLAIRAALGASRGRLVTQLAIESALLASAAVAAAVVLASWLDEGLRTVLLPSVAQSAGLTLRGAGAAAMAGVAALIVAAVAAIAQLPDSIRTAAIRGSGHGAHGLLRRRVQGGLLLVQTTLSVVLIAGAGMFARSLYNLVSQDFGMRMDDVVLVEFDRGPGMPAMRDDEWLAAIERVRQVPGVQIATVVQKIPFTGFHVIPVSVPGLAEPPNVNGQLPYLLAATPELFEILDVTMVEGRRFVAADERGAPVAIVNQTMARAAWPGQSALGKCFRIGFEPSFDPFTAAGPPPPPSTVPCREVVGVTRDLRQRSVVPTGSEAHLMQYFVPLSQVPAGRGPGPGIGGLLLRSSAAPGRLATPVREAVLEGRTDLPFLQVRPYADLLEPQMRPWRLGTALLFLFSALAVGVAAVGLYAAFAHAVTMRRHELAVRLAVGAGRQRVLVMILREAVTIAALGVVCGCAIALAGGRAVQAMLFGTAPSDPLVLGAAALVMVAVAGIATFIPALAASRTDPSRLLYSD